MCECMCDDYKNAYQTLWDFPIGFIFLIRDYKQLYVCTQYSKYITYTTFINRHWQYLNKKLRGKKRYSTVVKRHIWRMCACLLVLYLLSRTSRIDVIYYIYEAHHWNVMFFSGTQDESKPWLIELASVLCLFK